jgi:hypothetical protein
MKRLILLATAAGEPIASHDSSFSLLIAPAP